MSQGCTEVSELAEETTIKTIWDEFESARKEKETLHDYQVKQAPLDIWRKKAEAEFKRFTEQIHRMSSIIKAGMEDSGKLGIELKEAQGKLDRIIELQQRYCQGCSESCEYCRNMVLSGLKRILDSEKPKEEASP